MQLSLAIWIKVSYGVNNEDPITIRTIAGSYHNIAELVSIVIVN